MHVVNVFVPTHWSLSLAHLWVAIAVVAPGGAVTITFITLEVPTLAKMPNAKTKIDFNCILEEVLMRKKHTAAKVYEQYVEIMKKIGV